MSTPPESGALAEPRQEHRVDGPALFADRIAAEFAYSLRHGSPLSLLVLELRDPSRALPSNAAWRDGVRGGDIVARIDLRRVAIIAPCTDAPTASTIAARLREAVEGEVRIGHVTMSASSRFEGPGAMLRAAELSLS